MPEIARLIGGAGTGKTTELMRLLEQVIAQQVDPLQVGFVSFTRAARREASERAALQMGGSAQQLETDGWFRTLHSVCFRCLGAKKGEVLADDRAGDKWTEEHLGERAGQAIGEGDLDDEVDFTSMTDVGRALQLWHAARNRLQPLRDAWQYADAVSDRTPSYEQCEQVVRAYEQAKRLDGKCDFADLLGDFAGWRFGIDGHERIEPRGESPNLPVWFFDEQQDTSALLDAVCQRLIRTAAWVYVVGDPFQSVYGWSGADASLFMGWHVAKSRVMPKSYRCPASIHECGENILRESSDYWDREIKPADHNGSVEFERFGPGVFGEIEAAQSWLLLARTNYHANRIAKRVRELGIPWQPTRGNGGWKRPAKNKVLNALYDLADGAPIAGMEWKAAIAALPVKHGQQRMLEHGAKASWAMDKGERAKQLRYAGQLAEWGATPRLIEMIEQKTWTNLIDGAADYVAARDRWGYKIVTEPPVRIGTIHSVKGAEADNVLWLTTGTRATSKACEEQRGFDEECRVAYVAATRARRRLVVAVEPNQRNRFKVPA